MFFLVVACGIVGSAYILSRRPPGPASYHFRPAIRQLSQVRSPLQREDSRAFRVTVEERMTSSSGKNLRLLEAPDPASMSHSRRAALRQSIGSRQRRRRDAVEALWLRADVGFLPPKEGRSIRWWSFRGKKVSVGVVDGSGARALANSIFALNGLNGDNVTMLSIDSDDAIAALKRATSTPRSPSSARTQ